jgi:cyclopropane-fatty-acyl-phospholipid synthase
MLRSIVREQALRVVDHKGCSHLVGDGTAVATIRLRAKWLEYRLALNPALALGEAYMEGLLVVEDGKLYEFLEVLARNYGKLGTNPWLSLAERLGRGLKQANSFTRARRNVAHHYDLSDQLYDIFLDRERQYSCAYFPEFDASLEMAQQHKMRHLAAKLLLKPGLKVLDIGSGWGGLALYLARVTGADVTGVTLSAEQHKFSETRARESGLAGQVRFLLCDYRAIASSFDRIVSVGMFEHVGKRSYREFFTKVNQLLTEDGIAVLHSIGYSDAPAPINPFIRKYIFPGADLPSLSEVFRVVEKSGLFVTDLEILRLHYALTLRHWRQRLARRRDEIVRLYDERFYRMWEFYFVLCEIGFRYRTNMVFQMQMAKGIDTVPITRDYMFQWENDHYLPAQQLVNEIPFMRPKKGPGRQGTIPSYSRILPAFASRSIMFPARVFLGTEPVSIPPIIVSMLQRP